MSLSGGDSAFVFTDGVTEAMDVAGRLYSESRLENLLDKANGKTVEALARDTLESVEDFAAGAEQADDITILAFCLNQEPGQKQAHHRHFRIETNLAEIERVGRELDDFAGKYGIDHSIIQKLRIALDELVTNIISHGFNEGDDHSIEIRFDYSETQFVLEISDDGIPFNPFDRVKPDTSLSIEDREVGGLGVLLVEELVDDASYQWQDNKNVVKLIMNISG